MSQTETIPRLYHECRQERDTEVTVEQFQTFTVFFPTLIIIVSDGVIDLEEWEYVKQLIRFMAKTFKEKSQGVDTSIQEEQSQINEIKTRLQLES